MIVIQNDDFNVQEQYQQLIVPGETGAIVTFIGRVRDFTSVTHAGSFYLEHYPGMTEKVLHTIKQQAQTRWPLIRSTIIHRVGTLTIDDQIVYVGVSSKHRKHAFAACEFIIDLLKTQALFWKKEGEHWVVADQKDQLAADKWQT